MSKIHYFQRYGSKENWVTNSTLLLFSRLYHHSRIKFEAVINALLADSNLSLNIGVNFSQQNKGKNSVLDGMIVQESFRVAIETKLYDNFSIDQLKRHLDAFDKRHSQNILLALSKNKVDNKVRNEIVKTLQQVKYKDIKFASTTYEDIFQVISANLSDYETEMREILEDYIQLCTKEGLVNIQNHVMLAFTASESLKENFKYNIYYDPVSRNHNTPFKYIGLYYDKAVVGVGMLTKIICCDYQNGKLVATNGDDLSRLTPEEYNRVKDTIENTPYYDLRSGSKFFLVDKFYKTYYRKTSPSPIRAKKYFWLDELEGFKEGMTAEAIAKLLDGQTWK